MMAANQGDTRVLDFLRTCWRHIRHLRWVQMLLLGLILLLGFGVTGAFYDNYRDSVDTEKRNVRSSLERTTQLLSERIGQSVLLNNRSNIEQRLRLLETMPTIGVVVVANHQGDVLVRARKQDQTLVFADPTGPQSASGDTGFSGRFPALGYTSSIPFGTRTVGSITLRTDAPHVQASTDARFRQFLLESFVMWCVLGIFGGYLFIQTRFENRLRRQLHVDPVTGELSRFGFNERFRDRDRFLHQALLLVDLYDMKAINAGHGLAIGDRILQIVARTLRATLGPRAAVARLDGDDFAIMIPATQWASVQQIGHAVTTALHAVRFDEIDELEKIKVCGGAVIVGPEDSLSQRLSEADLALKHAKQRDWGRIVCADAEFIAHSQSTGAFVTDLRIRQGLKTHEFEYHIQPIVNVGTGETLGYESLIRWNCEGEMRPPAIFLDRFREVMKDDEYYAYVVAMRRALTQQAARSGVGFLTFNIGLEDLNNLQDPDQFAYDFGADCPNGPEVIIEVTERGLPQHFGDDLTGLKTAWEELRSRHTTLALDDFGALESNLYRLRELDIEYVKIDKTLITAVIDDPKSRAIVRSIGMLCEALDIHVVAEGIETETLSETVLSLGIPIQQGFLLGRPQPPAHYFGGGN